MVYCMYTGGTGGIVLKKNESAPIKGAKKNILKTLKSKLLGILPYAALIFIAICVCLTVNLIIEKKHQDIVTNDVVTNLSTVGDMHLSVLDNTMETVLLSQMYAMYQSAYDVENLNDEIEKTSLYRTLRHQEAFYSPFFRLTVYNANSDMVYDSVGTVTSVDAFYDKDIIELVDRTKDSSERPLDRLGYYFRYWNVSLTGVGGNSSYGAFLQPIPTVSAVLSYKSDVHFVLNLDLLELYSQYRSEMRQLYDADVVLTFNGNVILSDIGQEDAEEMLASLETDKVGYFWKNGAKRYRVVENRVSDFDMAFYTLIDETEITALVHASIREILGVQMFSFLLYLLIFAGIGLVFLRPIKKLLRSALQKDIAATHSSVKEMVATVVQIQERTTPIYTANLMTELLTEHIVEPSYVREALDTHGISFRDGTYYTCAIEIGNPNDEISEDELSLKKRLIVKRCNEIFKEDGFAVDLKDHLIGIACSAGKGREQTRSLIANINTLLITKLERHTTIAMGPEAETIFHLKPSFDRALDALEYRISFDNDEIIDCENLDIKYRILTKAYEKMQPVLLCAIKAGNAEKAESVTDELFQYIGAHRYEIGVREIVDVFLTLLQSIYDTVEEAKLTMNWEQSVYELYKLAMSSSKQELRKLVSKIVVTAACCFSASEKKEDNRQLRAVKKVCSYIDENYSSDVSLNDLAELVGLNPSYLSSIFKDIIGVSFSAYLENRRTEEAIRLMQSGTLRISQVAEAVGYSSPNYFSRVFRKRMGMSPEQYRNLLENGGEPSEKQ